MAQILSILFGVIYVIGVMTVLPLCNFVCVQNRSGNRFVQLYLPLALAIIGVLSFGLMSAVPARAADFFLFAVFGSIFLNVVLHANLIWSISVPKETGAPISTLFAVFFWPVGFFFLYGRALRISSAQGGTHS